MHCDVVDDVHGQFEYREADGRCCTDGRKATRRPCGKIIYERFCGQFGGIQGQG